MRKNLIFIFEFVSGGGFNRFDIPSSLLCEGFGMLRSITADFKALDFEILTMLDCRIFSLSKILQADFITKVKKSDDYLKLFKNLVNKCKYAFIIAPESSNILFKLTKIVTSYDVILLSTNLKGIKCTSSKIMTYKFFRKNKIKTPRTYRIPFKRKNIDINFLKRKLRELKGKIVVKPEDGVGAESIYSFENESQISNFFTKLSLNDRRNYVLQEFIEGRDLSISLVGAPHSDKNPIILSLNSQNIHITPSGFEYLGGYTPIENYKEKMKFLSGIIKNINPLKMEGYFGVDLIEKQDNTLSFIEINPRLTTSYIGLRNITNINIAELIFNSKLNIPNDNDIKLIYHSYFTRIDFTYHCENTKVFNEELIPKLLKIIPEFVTPPFSLNASNNYSCFIATKTKDLNSSKIRVQEIIHYLQQQNFKIIKPIGIKLS
jgi:predicted ATP-grasp superfamily ATP-dependent carboligase